ncbi:hypothetical protein ACFWFR_08235 [Oerskovia sp. NPDC060287]|uniref:hypothetical protein n=1 Tax=Oerskovia sp. NPDC060287 TaxID=3347095 RepID=UPI0036577B00
MVFEKWNDGSVLQPTVFPEEILQRARRSLTLHQLRKGEGVWFPDSVMNRPQAAAVLGIEESATPSEIAIARGDRYRLYSFDGFGEASSLERAAASATMKQLDEAALVLQAAPTILADRSPSGPVSSSTAAPGSDDVMSGSPVPPYSAYPSDPESLLLAGARAAAKAEFGRAVLWLAGGAAVTAITYAAAPDGGSYVVFWGAMLYGAWRTVKASYFLLNPGALVRRAGR